MKPIKMRQGLEHWYVIFVKLKIIIITTPHIIQGFSSRNIYNNTSIACKPAALLAIGSFDGKIRLVSTYSWQVAFVLHLTHPKDLDICFHSAHVITTVEVSSSLLGDTENLNFTNTSKSTLKGTKSSTLKKHNAIDPSTCSFVQKNLKVLPKVLNVDRGDTKMPAMGVSWIGW